MKTVLSASLVLAAVTLGASAWAAETAAAEPAPAAADASPETAAAATTTEATTETTTVEATAPEAAAAEAQPSDAPKAEPAQQPAQQPQLVEGAPLGNANVNVHIVQKKPYINEGRHEVVLYPAVLQVNGKFTQHYGIGLMYAYHLFENLAIQLTPLWNYWNQESGFNEELIQKGHQQAEAATALLIEYGGTAGVEVTPMYGKFAFYEGTLGSFTFVINAGVGAGSSRVQLRQKQVSRPESLCGPGQDNECRAAAFADTGVKFLGSVGAGFRVFLGERAAIRLEVRDLIYTAQVSKINGCDALDFESLRTGGQPLSGSCNVGAFVNTDDRQLANAMVRTPSSDVVNNVSFFAGFSFLF